MFYKRSIVDYEHSRYFRRRYWQAHEYKIEAKTISGNAWETCIGLYIGEL